MGARAEVLQDRFEAVEVAMEVKAEQVVSCHIKTGDHNRRTEDQKLRKAYVVIITVSLV